MKSESKNGLLKVGIIGTVVTALCCFTPVLVVLLAVIGLGSLTGYLDFILLPALCVFFIITVVALVRRQKRSDDSSGLLVDEE